MSAREDALRLGSNVVELLLPQRRPFLMVDFVESFHAGPPAVLEAARLITANESCFEGHFPGLHLWPGALTIEGLAQACALLMALRHVTESMQAEGAPAGAVREELLNLDRGYRLHPGYRPADADRFLERLRPLGDELMVAGSVEVKLLQPVFAGQRLDYVTRLAGSLGELARFEVEARVNEVPVARGVITGSRLPARRPASR